MPNTVNEWLTTAKAMNPERAAKWREVFGTDEVPITCPIPLSVGSFPQVGEKPYYLMDLRAITPEQKERLIASIAFDFDLSIEEVRRDIDMVGVPILADDVIASSSDSGLFFSMIDIMDDFGEKSLEELDPWEEDEAEMADYYWGDDSED
jgi:hypothetical protein